jgi:hypothetical protein
MHVNVGLVLMAVLVVLGALGLRLQYLILCRLRDQHESIWMELGKPTLVQLTRAHARRAFWSFVFKRRFSSLADTTLERNILLLWITALAFGLAIAAIAMMAVLANWASLRPT